MPPVAPMLAKPVAELPDGAFSFEPKWDGFRTIVFRDSDEVELGSRNERPMTRYFPELVDAIKAHLPSRCVLDAEIVVPDAAGRRLDFNALLLRIHPAASRVALLATQTPARLIAFDLGAVGDVDYTGQPFARRRAALERALATAGPPVHLTPATTDRDRAGRWLRRFEGAGLDGVIAKRLDGVYEPDRRALFKVKHARTVDCVVAGRLPAAQTRRGPDRLAAARPVHRRRRAGQRRGDRRVPAGPAQGAVHRAAAAGDQLPGAPVGLGRLAERGRPAHLAGVQQQPLEPRQGATPSSRRPSTSTSPRSWQPQPPDRPPAHRQGVYQRARQWTGHVEVRLVTGFEYRT